MKKYVSPVLEEEKVEIEDVIAASGVSLGSDFGDGRGDHNGNFFSLLFR